MALQPNRLNYMPQPGLAPLGNVLLQASGDFANQRLRQQDEDRRRAQAIADLQDSRQYAQGQRAADRTLALGDEQRRRGERVEDVTLEILIKENWLSPTDARDPMKVQEAAARREVEVAKTKGREATLPEKLQKEADYYGQKAAEISADQQRVNNILSEPEPPPPTIEEVANRARQMTGKKVPTREEINQQAPAALKAIQEERAMSRWQKRESAKAQIPMLRYAEMETEKSLRPLIEKGFVPNRPPPAEKLENPPPAPKDDAAEAAAFLKKLNDALPGDQPAPAPAMSSAVVNRDYSHLNPSALWLPGIMSGAASILNPVPKLDAAARYGGAATRGFATGDYSVPETGPYARAIEDLAAPFAPKQGDYTSEARARLLNLPRSPDPLPPIRRTPASAFAFPGGYGF